MSDWSSDVCSSDLAGVSFGRRVWGLVIGAAGTGWLVVPDHDWLIMTGWGLGTSDDEHSDLFHPELHPQALACGVELGPARLPAALRVRGARGERADGARGGPGRTVRGLHRRGRRR